MSRSSLPLDPRWRRWSLERGCSSPDWRWAAGRFPVWPDPISNRPARTTTCERSSRPPVGGWSRHFATRQRREPRIALGPTETARRTIDIVQQVRPNAILVDHLAFGATIGLRAIGAPYADVILGHPRQLPLADETYGVPGAWPHAFAPDTDEMADLRSIARRVADGFTGAYNAALRAVSADAPPVEDAFGAPGPLVLLNYPQALHDARRTARLPRAHVFLGATPRREQPSAEVDAWLGRDGGSPVGARLTRDVPVRPGRRAYRHRPRPATARRSRGIGHGFHGPAPSRLPADGMARQSISAPGEHPPAGQRPRHSRWQQQRHRGPRSRRSDAHAAVLDGSVRRCCGHRGRPLRLGGGIRIAQPPSSSRTRSDV